MAQGNRPECEKPAHQKHPDTYTRKVGRYGSEGQYQRWQCVPGNGDDPHYISWTLPRRKVDGHKKGCAQSASDRGGRGTVFRHPAVTPTRYAMSRLRCRGSPLGPATGRPAERHVGGRGRRSPNTVGWLGTGWPVRPHPPRQAPQELLARGAGR